jgi:hypothetical protein
VAPISKGAPFAALLLAIADDRIHRVFFHTDLDRLRRLGPRNPRPCFGLTLFSAGIAHFSVGDKLFFVLDPLLFLAALVTSYSYFMKFNRNAVN